MSKASELLVEVTILAVLLLLLFCSYKSGFLSAWVGLLSNGVSLFSRERVLKNTLTPPL